MAVTARAQRGPAAFAHREYRVFWLGAVVSSIGNWMQNVTVPYVLYELTGSGVWVGMAIVAQILPSILLNPLSGSLADRFSRRKLLVLSQSVAGLSTFALAVMWAAGAHSPVAVLALVALSGTVLMVTQPAWQAIVVDLVPPEDQMSAITLNSAQANTARAVGPAIGGVILGTLGPTWAFGFNAGSFGVVVLVLAFLRFDEHRGTRPEGRVLAQYREAAAYARRQRGMLTAYGLTAVLCGLGYPVFQLAILFTEEVYRVGPSWYGALTAAYGVGAVVGAVLLGVLGRGRTRGEITRLVLAVQAAATVGFGLSTSFWVGAPLLAIVGAGSLCVIAVLNTAIQASAPPDMRGRLLALWILSYTASYPLGSVLEGALADRFGVRVVVTGAGLLMCAAAGLLVLRPELARSLDGDE